MCGILGIVSERLLPDSLDLNCSLDLLSHRGPDDRGSWSSEFVILGHTRLSILDLSSLGHQPMSDADQRFHITFNGEIYNYIELKGKLIGLGYRFFSQTDTEVILAAYSEWGSACLHKLRGMFAFAIWDECKKTLFVARDRVGEKPLYYSVVDKQLYFSSELRALLRLLPGEPSLNSDAIDLYCHYQYIPEPLTPFEGICKLPAAHYLFIHAPSFQISLEQYWNIEDAEPISGDPPTLIREKLNEIIDLTLRSDAPVGVSLSGGIDSSALTALAAPRYGKNLQTFSVGYPGYPPYDERKKAKDFASSLGLSFFSVDLETQNLVREFPKLVAMMDEPVADIAAYGHYSVQKLAAQHGVKVMLGGIGGDELFWGYSTFTDAAKLSVEKVRLLSEGKNARENVFSSYLRQQSAYQKLVSSPKVPSYLRSKIRQLTTASSLTLERPYQAIFQDLATDFKQAQGLLPKLYTQNFSDLVSYRNEYTPFADSLGDCSNVPIRICKLLFDTWLVSNCLSIGDRLSMSASVEARTPFLDYQLVDLVMGLRKTYPDHHLGYKYWLRQALSGILPQEILNRPKQGFQPPVYEWIIALLNEYSNYLKDGHLVELGIIERKQLEGLLSAFRKSKQELFILYKLLLFEVWYREIIAICSR